MHGFLSRRGFTAGSAALLANGCASLAPDRSILVNLADAAPAPTTDGDAGAQLGGAADLTGRMAVPVRINRQGPFNFVIDTGANRTVLSSELAADLSLPSAGPANIHGIAGVEPAETVWVETLEVDAVVTRRMRAPVLPRSRLGTDGLLGVDVLRDRRVVMDFGRGQLRIWPSGAGGRTTFDMRATATSGPGRDLGPGVVVPARYRFGQLIIIGADVSGKKVTAFLDSGAQSTVGNMPLSRVVRGANPDPKLVRYLTPLLSATGQTAQGEVAVLPLLRIGGLTITGLQAVFTDLHVFDIWDLASTPSLLIGVDVMSQFEAVQLDFGRRLVTFYPKKPGRR
jgi:predicted aspartyl protease